VGAAKPIRTLEAGDPVCIFSTLLGFADLAFEDEPAVEHALYSWKDSIADFADCLIEARNRPLGCQATATFDARALKLPGFVPVSRAAQPRDGKKGAGISNQLRVCADVKEAGLLR